MARRRSARRSRRSSMHMLPPVPMKTGLGALTDSKFFIPGLIGVGALAFLMLRKKKPDAAAAAAAEVQKIVGEAQRATKAAAESVAAAETAATPPVQQQDQMVSMGSDKPKTVTDLVAQVRANEIASGPAGTEMQGGGSVSADPKEQLKLMSTVDFLGKLVKSPEFKAAVMAGVPVGGDLGGEMERRFGADGRKILAEKALASAFLLSEVIRTLQLMYANGVEDDYIAEVLFFNKNKDMKGKFVEGRKVEDDAFYTLAYYNVVAQELADRAAGRKPEPVPSADAPRPGVAAEPVKVMDPSSGMLVDAKPTKILKIGEVSVKFRYPIKYVDPAQMANDVLRPIAGKVTSLGASLDYKQSVSEFWHSIMVFAPEGVSLDKVIEKIRGSSEVAYAEPIGMATVMPMLPEERPRQVAPGFVRPGMTSPGQQSKPPAQSQPASAFPVFNIAQGKPVGQMQPAVMQSSLPPVPSTPTGGSFRPGVLPGGFKPLGR